MRCGGVVIMPCALYTRRIARFESSSSHRAAPCKIYSPTIVCWEGNGKQWRIHTFG